MQTMVLEHMDIHSQKENISKTKGKRKKKRERKMRSILTLFIMMHSIEIRNLNVKYKTFRRKEEEIFGVKCLGLVKRS